MVDWGGTSNISPHVPQCVSLLWLGDWSRDHNGPQNTMSDAATMGFLLRETYSPLAIRRGPGQWTLGGLSPCTVTGNHYSEGALVFANYSCNSEHIEMGLRNEEMCSVMSGFACLFHCLCYLNILLCKYKGRKWVTQNLITTVPSFREADMPRVWGVNIYLVFQQCSKVLHFLWEKQFQYFKGGFDSTV